MSDVVSKLSHSGSAYWREAATAKMGSNGVGLTDEQREKLTTAILNGYSVGEAMRYALTPSGNTVL